MKNGKKRRWLLVMEVETGPGTTSTVEHQITSEGKHPTNKELDKARDWAIRQFTNRDPEDTQCTILNIIRIRK